MQTRSQEYSETIFNQIDNLEFTVDEANEEKRQKKIKKLKKQYGSLCHNFPIMVLRSGLSQAVAFVWIKAKNDAGTPHGYFLKHLSALTDGSTNETPAAFQKRINEAELTEYQRLSRKVLAASIWYKRFAESLLEVKAGEDHDEH